MSKESLARERMWRSMRMMTRFDAPGIATTADVKIASARSYIQALKDAGYLEIEKKARPGQPGEYSIYRLCRNSGPKFPQIDPCRLVFDPNTGNYYAPKSTLEKAKNALEGSPA